MTYQKLLENLGACGEARQDAGKRDMETVLRTCQRADWLLWLYGHMAGKAGWATRKQVVLAACACAATALPRVRAKDRPAARKAIAAARAWARGKATLIEVRASASAASDAADAAAYAAYASDAASAASAASDAASAAYAAAAYASDAASASDAAAADASAAADAARKTHLAAMVPLVHKFCPMPKNARCRGRQ